ncbi:TrkA C-terminal domain-containing protein [Halostella sp. PRR32]|uniref:potassium channel family protein n=1 Tax=Halostella sp. PRR32 TaxID=3098147 RepID=UPI002B1D56BA|nr:TrkA C-terminal domain-containing protein [Halostella sp. PRR32]
MPTLPVEVLLGIYLGLLTGIFPALVSGGLGFVFKYFTGVTLPGLGVVVLAVAVAGVNGGLLGLIDPTIKQSPRLLVAVTVVMMLSLYAHSQGDKLGTTLPKRFSLRSFRPNTLSTDVVEFVGGIGQVTITPTGQVDDMEGYPPLQADVRAAIREGSWQFPADVPLAELERRLTERLQSEHDLADAVVSINSRGRATISAAPPSGGLSARVPAGHRAVSVSALVPTGIARGDRVRVVTENGAVEGTVLSARSTPDAESPEPMVTTDGGAEAAAVAARPVAPTTTGGEGRVTVAVRREAASTLLRASRGDVVVLARGVRGEYELVSLLRGAGARIRRLTVASDSDLVGRTLGEADVRETDGVAVLAVKRGTDQAADASERWQFSPDATVSLAAGDELFAVGTSEALDRLGGTPR